MNEMTLEERVEDLETAVYNLIQMVNKLKEQSEVIDVISMDKELKEIREKEKFLDTHKRVVASLKNMKGEVI